MRVLLVEDDRMIGSGLMAPLSRAGMAVDWVRTAEDAAESLAAGAYALVLLDLGLPDASGLGVLGDLRRAGSEVPVLVITARDGIDDRVAGLDKGADDYLVKPFEVSELLARIRALTRRRTGAPRRACLEAEGLLLDLASQELDYLGKREVLSPREFALMRALMERPGIILSRSQIEDHVYSWSQSVESNAVDVLIHAVRRRFDKNVIRNVRGAGWMVLKRKP